MFVKKIDIGVKRRADLLDVILVPPSLPSIDWNFAERSGFQTLVRLVPKRARRS